MRHHFRASNTRRGSRAIFFRRRHRRLFREKTRILMLAITPVPYSAWLYPSLFAFLVSAGIWLILGLFENYLSGPHRYALLCVAASSAILSFVHAAGRPLPWGVIQSLVFRIAAGPAVFSVQAGLGAEGRSWSSCLCSAFCPWFFSSFGSGFRHVADSIQCRDC
jgi:hypothetical protein